MVSFSRHFMILLFEVLIVGVIIIANGNVRRFDAFPSLMNSISRNIIHNSSDDSWFAINTVITMQPLYYKWDVKWFKLPIDHFSYRNAETFDLKYLTNYSYYHCGGPLFFYTGNEGYIELFAKNTGIMWDLAPHFHAALVFAEHRYYGASKPYGKQSDTDASRLGYLNEIQALADFAELISFVKNDQNELGFCPPGTEIPVIVFGGSYGGMLAAWFRLKYPHIVDGAWASSAPMRDFYGTGTKLGYVSNKTASSYVNSGCDRKVFSEGFMAIRTLSQTDHFFIQMTIGNGQFKQICYLVKNILNKQIYLAIFT